MLSDKQSGLWQTCAEMVASKHENQSDMIIYGVYTDYSTWQFLSLENNKIKKSIIFSLLSGEREFNLNIYPILKFLFFIIGIPPNFNLNISMDNIKVAREIKSTKLMKQLKELKESKEENVRLQEMLSKKT